MELEQLKRRVLGGAFLAVVGAVGILVAQDTPTQPPPAEQPPEVPEVPPTSTPVEQGNEPILYKTGLMNIRTLLVEDFEDADSWVGSMPRDNGIIVTKRREGAPGEVKRSSVKNKTYVLGAKVSFFKTGATHFAMTPPKEIHIPGITKSLSIWVAGRNYSHKLYALIRDVSGNLHKIQMGDRLNFPGWSRLTGQIPDHILQNDIRYIAIPGRNRGISLVSLHVECNMRQTTGTYYFYADQLEAESDMFLEDPNNQDPDDMVDDW